MPGSCWETMPTAPRDKSEPYSSAALGWVMSAGTTHWSNCSSVRKPSSRADSRSDSPLWWAFLAILDALSYPMWRLRAVTCIRLVSRLAWIRSRFGSIP